MHWQHPLPGAWYVLLGLWLPGLWVCMSRRSPHPYSSLTGRSPPVYICLLCFLFVPALRATAPDADAARYVCCYLLLLLLLLSTAAAFYCPPPPPPGPRRQLGGVGLWRQQ
jgi:O-antigen ligase